MLVVVCSTSAMTSAYGEALSYKATITSRVFRLWVTVIDVADPFPTLAAYLVTTTARSITTLSAFTVIPSPPITSSVLAVFVRPAPAVICPRPVNCVKLNALVPTVIVPLLVSVQPESAFTVPSSTKTAKEAVISAAVSASDERVGAPEAATT